MYNWKTKRTKKLIIKNLKAIAFRKGVGNKVTKDKVSMFVLLWNSFPKNSIYLTNKIKFYIAKSNII
jgi:hypothetical protein